MRSAVISFLIAITFPGWTAAQKPDRAQLTNEAADLWRIRSEAITEDSPESIFKMTTPSHILLRNDGIVIRVWPGSFKDKPVRQLMARQIVADTGVAIDTLKAMQLWH
jgi:hypothetical protein